MNSPGLVDSFAILSKLPLPVMVLKSSSGDVLFMNDKFRDVFGYSEKDIKTEQDWWPRAFPDEQYRLRLEHEWERRVRMATAAAGEMEPLEAVAKCKDGRDCAIRKHLSVHGGLFIITMVDISDQKYLQREYEQLASTDALTGLSNRRAFFTMLDQALALANRHSRPLSILIADIDHFKAVNDTYGHQAGDAVLEHFSRIILRTLRTSDTAARIGGEEFAILLPETDKDGAYRLADRMRIIISENVCYHERQPIQITVSVGLACYSGPNIGQKFSCDAFLRLADDALYRSKREGRNRVSTAELRIP
ncbi:sensor domain-containing diguanylate cyclase [Fundidesulfovibrio terrae]|uniref:sensor domain-containing diguanylate cyclase n=1 Tax=Fundidesulfovibrio terrae TaxID=2922866 RepID=UPI001FAFB083|nr:sensor domain-containing diguanylate cyclase [Fundidesulfovibrio terrae]